MSIDVLIALSVFALVSSITPGPNNLMLLASGANFGFTRSLPHMMGVAIGFTLMVFLVGVGLIGLFDLIPYSYEALKIFSAIYLCWLAWKIANSAAPGSEKSGGRPITFLQAALFQWVNPKAWSMALTAIALYAPDRSLTAVFMVTIVFGMVNFPSISFWTLLGLKMRALLSNAARLKAFNYTMAIALVATLYPVLF
ncbi:MAG: LysE family translocator [Paracoccaceae bacterium]|nr:LysE family translocator [Paracoccaceae bacterium]MDG2257119.1 LysE family translocator [Paracoccaceae bacterium]